jgi:glycosyltransferase involved in cell wall biosynthesis
MKILYHHRTRSKDGQYVHIEEMIAALRELGHEVIVVSPPSTEGVAFGSDAGLVAWMKRHVPKLIYELLELSYSLIAYRRLVQAVRMHHPDCLYERYNLFLPAGIWLKKKFKLPMLLEVNSPIFEERSRFDGVALKWLAHWTQIYTWHGADYVLPVTKVLGDMLAATGIPRQQIVNIPNAINIRNFDGATSARAAKLALGLQGHLVLGFTGFLRDWHGLDKVIDLISQDSSTSLRHLLIVGDGPARAALEEQAKSLGISNRVTFTGIVPRDMVAQYVATFDIALQPAVVAYASPLKLFEYLALGKAIVAPAQANIMEILADGDNALLFDPLKSNGLAIAIDRLSNDPELRLKIGARAHQTISDKQLTWNENAKHVVQLFDELVARHA